MSDLKQSTKKAVVWSALDKGGQQLLILTIQVVLTRYLASEAFGLVAPLALFAGVANTLTDGGLSAALIRKTDVGDRDFSTMFWFNVLLGAVFYALLYALSPWIAAYNGTPQLTLLARVQFLSVVFYSLGLIQSTLLVKRSDFRRLGFVNVTSVFLTGIVAFILLFNGFGVWAIVGLQVGQAFFRSLLLWILVRWTPRPIFDVRSFRQMFRFSSKLILGTLANNFSLYFYASALGNFLHTRTVGFYERAHKIRETGAGFFSYTFGSSIYLMLSLLQHDPARFLQAFRKSVRSIAFLLLPAMLGLAVVAEQLVELAITAEYLPVVPYLRILCVAGILTVMNYFYGNALKARGRSDVTLVLEVANALLIVVFLFLTIRYGLITALWADVAVRLTIFACYAAAADRLLGYRLRDQLHDLIPYAGLAVSMALLIWPLRYAIHSDLLLLAAQVGIGALFYWAINKWLGSKVLGEIHQMIRDVVKRP